MTTAPLVSPHPQETIYDSQHPSKFTMERNFESPRVNGLSRKISEADVSTSNTSYSSYTQQQVRSSDPFDLYTQLHKQKKHRAENSDTTPLSRANTLGSMNGIGSLANMGSLGDLSMVLSQGPASGTMNGLSNQSWGNPNNPNATNERMHSSLPVMNASFGNLNTKNNITNQRSISMVNMGNNQRANDFQGNSSNELFPTVMADGIGSFHDVGNSMNGNYRPEGVASDGFGSGMSQKDFTKMTNEELREIIMMDAVGNAGLRGNLQSSASTPCMSTTNKSNTDYNNNANPFLKNLGIMNYRNHVLPLHLSKHSSKSSRQSNSIDEDQQMFSGSSDHTSSSGFYSGNSEKNDLSNSNAGFSYQPELQEEEEYGTMPDEQESYNAAANGILAPWSARAAGLFGDMMEQSNEDEKARKASRKKPKDKPKRPLSAYNIFFKEERSRILSGKDANGEANGDSNAEATEATDDESSTTSEDEKPGDKKDKTTHGKIGFESLAKLIGRRWQELDDESMSAYKSKASVDMERYKREMEIWNAKNGTTSRKRYSKSKSAMKRRSSCVGSINTEKAPKLQSAPEKKEEDLLNMQGGTSTEAAMPSTKLSPTHSTRPISFTALSKARLGSDLFQLTSVGDESQPILLEQV